MSSFHWKWFRRRYKSDTRSTNIPLSSYILFLLILNFLFLLTVSSQSFLSSYLYSSASFPLSLHDANSLFSFNSYDVINLSTEQPESQYRKLQALDCDEGFILINNICEPCPAGRYWTTSSDGTPRCDDCPPGSFSLPAAVNQAECRQCPLGFYSSSSGTAICESCGANSTTMEPGTTTSNDCFCAPGFRLVQTTSADRLVCQKCDDSEWCLPGRKTSYWTINSYCSSQNKAVQRYGEPGLCAEYDSSSPQRYVQGKCYLIDQCPTSEALVDGNLDCIEPYKGVKCRECGSGYGRSLVKGLNGPCEGCAGHYVFLTFFIIGMTIISVCVILLVKSQNTSRALVIIRVFIEHWQILSILRHLNIPWVGIFAPWLEFISMGFPLAEILSCLINPQAWTSPVIIVIQIISFFPLILIIWSVVIGFIVQQLRNWARRKNENAKKPQGDLPEAEKCSKEDNSVKGNHRVNRRLSLSISRARSVVMPNGPPEGWKYFGAFTFLYFSCLASVSLPLFWSSQCVHVEATGKEHLFAGLDTVCGSSDQHGVRAWGNIAIALWVWLVPLIYVLILWFKAHSLVKQKFSDGWGYLLQGYRRDSQCWQCLAILRLTTMITIAGATNPWQPSPIVIAFAARSIYVYYPAKRSDSGSYDAVLGGMLMYLGVEVIREIYSVGVSSADYGVMYLVRLSTIAIAFTWAGALVAKVESTGTFGDLSLIETEVDRSAPESSIDATDFKVRRATIGWLHFLCAVAGIMNILFLIWSMMTMVEGFSAPRWLRQSFPTVVSIEAKVRAISEKIGAFSRKFRQHTENAAVETYESVAAVALGGERIQQAKITPKAVAASGKTTLSQLRRSLELGIIKKEDVAAAIETIEVAFDRPQAIAALLRLTLHPFILVGEPITCLNLLSSEGFDRRALEECVRSYTDFRFRVLERICLLPEEFLIEGWWTSRRLGLLRYPVLEDSSLQLIAPVTVARIRQASTAIKIGSDNSDTTATENGTRRVGSLRQSFQDIQPSVHNEKNKFFQYSIGDFAWFVGSVIVRGKLSKARKHFAAKLLGDPEGHSDLYDVPHRITVGGVEDPFLQDLAQRVLHCLFLDLSDFRYHIPRELPIDRFLATGVPPGTRNDGKTDTTIRNYRDLSRKPTGTVEAERPEHSIILGRLLRKRVEEARIKEDITRAGQQQVAAAFQFAEIESPELRRKRDLEAVIEVTGAFVSLFPDARKAIHAISGEKDRTPNPEKLVTVMQDKTVVPRTQTVQHETETYVGFFQRIAGYLHYEMEQEAVQPSPEIPTPPKHVEHKLHEEELEIPYLLFSLTCVGGEFSADPPEVGVFVFGNLQYTTGHDGTTIALDTTRPLKLGKESEEDLRTLIASDSLAETVPLPDLLARKSSYITIDPIVELTPVPLGSLVQGDADWTLEAWIFLPLFPPNLSAIYRGHNLISDITFHTIAASDKMDSLLSIELPSGRFGMWCETQGRKYVSYGPEGVLVQPIELDSLRTPCWHFISITACVRRDDPSDPNSRIITLARLYVNGKFGGRLDREGLIENMESIGNTMDGRQAFGKFSSLTLLPLCLPPKQIAARYKERRLDAERRIRGLQAARKEEQVQNQLGDVPSVSVSSPQEATTISYGEYENYGLDYEVAVYDDQEASVDNNIPNKADSPLEETRPPSPENDPSRATEEV